jgi:hypothetical protein
MNHLFKILIYSLFTFTWQIAYTQTDNKLSVEILYLNNEALNEQNWSQKVFEYVESIKEKYMWNYLVTDEAYTDNLLKHAHERVLPKLDKHQETLTSFNKITYKKELFLEHGKLLNLFSTIYLSNPFDFGINFRAANQATLMKELFTLMNPAAVEIKSHTQDEIGVELSLLKMFMEVFPNDKLILEIKYQFFKDLLKEIEQHRYLIILYPNKQSLFEINLFDIKDTLLDEQKYIAHKNELNATFDYMMAFIGANIEPLAIGEIFQYYPITAIFRKILSSVTNLDLKYQRAQIKDEQQRLYLFSMPKELRSKHLNTRTYHMWLSYGLTKILINKGFHKNDVVMAVQALGILYEFLSPTTGRIRQALEADYQGRYYWMVRQTTALRLLAVYFAAGYDTSNISVDSVIDLMYQKSELMQKISFKIKMSPEQLKENYYADGAEETKVLSIDQLVELYLSAKYKSGGTPYKLVNVTKNKVFLNEHLNTKSWQCEIVLGGLARKILSLQSLLKSKSR